MLFAMVVAHRGQPLTRDSWRAGTSGGRYVSTSKRLIGVGGSVETQVKVPESSW